MVEDCINLLELLREKGVDGDFLQEVLGVFMNEIVDAEVTARIGADHGEVNEDPTD